MKSKIQAKYQIKRGLFIVNYSRQEIKLFSAFYALWALILVHLHLYGLFTVNKKWGYFRLLRNVWIYLQWTRNEAILGYLEMYGLFTVNKRRQDVGMIFKCVSMDDRSRDKDVEGPTGRGISGQRPV